MGKHSSIQREQTALKTLSYSTQCEFCYKNVRMAMGFISGVIFYFFFSFLFQESCKCAVWAVADPNKTRKPLSIRNGSSYRTGFMSKTTRLGN